MCPQPADRSPNRPPATEPAEATVRKLAATARELAREPDPTRALWQLVCLVRDDLHMDRAGVFCVDAASARIERSAGVSPSGNAEFEGQSFPLDGGGPLHQVCRRELPYYFTDDAPRDYPDWTFRPGVRAHAIVPIMAGDELLGALAVDNCLSGNLIAETSLEALFLYVGLAALPLFALYQQKERARTEAMRRRIYREVLYAVTGGKIRLCDDSEISEEWPDHGETIPIRRELDVRGVRETARNVGIQAGMTYDRAADFALCASEAATNALVHGSGGTAMVANQNGRVRVRVQDQGEGIATDDLPRATLLKGWSKRDSTGLGFTLIHETADRIFLYTGPSGTTLILDMAVDPKPDLLNGFNPGSWGLAPP